MNTRVVGDDVEAQMSGSSEPQSEPSPRLWAGVELAWSELSVISVKKKCVCELNARWAGPVQSPPRPAAAAATRRLARLF